MLNFEESDVECSNCGVAKETCGLLVKIILTSKNGEGLANIMCPYVDCYKRILNEEADGIKPSQILSEVDHRNIHQEEEKVVHDNEEVFYDENYGEYSESESDSDSDSSADSSSDSLSDSDFSSDSDYAPKTFSETAIQNFLSNAQNTFNNALKLAPQSPMNPKKKRKYQLSVKEEAFINNSVMIVPDKVYKKDFTKTYYFKMFKRTPRYPPLKEALKDLKKIFKCNKSIAKYIQRCYNKYNIPGYRDSEVKIVTKIWTASSVLTGIINASLIIDAVKVFGEQVYKNVNFFRRILAKNKVNHKTVINLSIKFMRLLNSYIVDLGTKYNKEDRVVYRGVRAEIFSDVKDGEIFRMIGWNCASENLHIAKKFEKHGEGKASSLVKFNVKAHCSNAGQINCFGVSKYKSEEETLIPPYSACICIKKEQMKAEDFTEEAFDTISTKEEEKRDDFNTEQAEDREDDPKKKADGGKAERLRTVFVMNLAKDNKNIKKDLKCSF